MSNSTCTSADCDRDAVALGLCSMHHQRHYRAGRRWPRVCERCDSEFEARWSGTRFCSTKCRGNESPSRAGIATGSRAVQQAFARTIAAAFAQQDWPTVLTRVREQCLDDGDCWIWLGATKANGYGVLTISGRRTGPHRVAAIAAHEGHAPVALTIHHTCAKSLCCNPEHLQWVTAEDNAAEMLDRHRLFRRIEALEAALADVDPEHPLIFGL